MDWLCEAGNALLDFLYPPKCYLCGRVGAWVCEGCIDAWPRPEEPRCPNCGEPVAMGGCRWCTRGLSPLSAASFSCAFDEGARDAVHLLKYSGKRRLAVPMADAMAFTFHAARPLRGADALVPIALHRDRLRQRGYNQSEWLAEELTPDLCIPVEDWLTRTRPTRPQVGLSAEERQQNVRGAFSAAPQAAGRRILLIDDVSTTGATAKAAANALKHAGATWVGLLTFARDL